MKHGASINIKNDGGTTPVHYAAMWNSTEAIAMLMEQGTSINIKDNRGDKPIDTARRWKREAAVHILEQL